MDAWLKWQTIFTGLTAFFTLIYTIGTFLLWRATRRANLAALLAFVAESYPHLKTKRRTEMLRRLAPHELKAIEDLISASD